MKGILTFHWALAASIWYLGSGLLHTIAVLIRHKGEYDRELLRLLMDGHFLMISGAIMFISWRMLVNNIHYGGMISLIVSGFMLIYCAMIFPFLKSFFTMALSIILIIVSIRAINTIPNLHHLK
jgi:hypothetical protein